ncbi:MULTISPECIES: GNAT family acetyltransferase [Mycolicibacterium]|nr:MULTISPECIES: GNAT family acetyltransferase [Mycolicibacterium]MCV7335363.1 GNAT family N-acetyltransferase [Mycolicibacterium senegalense]MDR7290683.1 ribosomal protein S18 acetylase RimI-like enzyme [Mycolicibacterium senegalense]QZA22253.1 GNAT family N-acetyltransferase [Mycolicibacterium senegalense]
MTLEFVDYRRGTADKYTWKPPFDWSVSYEQERWWDEPRDYVPEPWFLQVLQSGVEVARVELDDPGAVNPEYEDVPALGDERLEIQLIEVSTAARRQRIGTSIVRAIEARFPDRRLFAYSEGADEFWAHLGWKPHYRPSRPPARTLFIQPGR